jgi:hypothetical protein
MTIIGETYQVGGTTQNAYCRSKRLIPATDCYGIPCQSPVCNQEQNYYQFYAYGVNGRGLSNYNPYVLASLFLCEEP